MTQEAEKLEESFTIEKDKNVLRISRENWLKLKDEIWLLEDELSQLEKEIHTDIFYDGIYSDDGSIEKSDGEIIPVSLPTQPAGTIVNPQLKAAQELNAAIKTSVSRQFKVIDGKKHEITEEWIGKKPEGGFVPIGTEGDKYN